MSLFVFHIVLLYIKSLSLSMSEVHEFFFSFCDFCVIFVFFSFSYCVTVPIRCGLVFDANFRKFPVFFFFTFLRVVEFTNYKVPGYA